MNFARISQIYQTVRHLQPVQITNRLRRRFVRPSWRPLVAPPRRDTPGRWQPSGQRDPTLVADDQMQVFQERIVLRSASDWQNDDLSPLARYNLHYFDDLNARHADQRTPWHESLVDRWIDQNPPGHGTGWEPYPLSLRIVNWIRWSLGGHPLKSRQLDSLATQAQALSEQLEYHLLANHLIANAKALLFAGAFFQGPRAERWLRLGARIFRQQIAEQVLSDGGHFELSPMYHSVILEDVLDVMNLARAYAGVGGLNWAEELREVSSRMRRWLRVMTHPDGQISLFNDAAIGVAIAPSQIEQYAARLGLASVDGPSGSTIHLRASGYVRLEQGDAVVLIDVAKIGPDYQPGHAHADSLSFEWSLGQQRIMVNSGTSCYGTTRQRLVERGTAAHNTVVVDGQDSSEVWGGFRVARRARPGPITLDESDMSVRVTGSHDGYRRLPGRVTHRRRWTLSANQLCIDEMLTGRFQQAVARFHLHPQVSIQPGDSPDVFHMVTGDRTLRARIVGGKPQHVESAYHPQFGASVPNSCLESLFRDPVHQLLIDWSGRSSGETTSVESHRS